MDYKDYNDYELLYMVREDEDNFNIIFYKYQPLIRKIAFSFWNNYRYLNLDVEDLIQEGNIALYKAVRYYNSYYGVLFYTYVYNAVKNAIYNVCVKGCGMKNRCNLFCDDVDSIYDCGYVFDYDGLMIDYDCYFRIVKFKNNLDFKDSLVFELRYNGFDYKSIARLLDMKVKQVDNRLYKIKKKLKKIDLFDV